VLEELAAVPVEQLLVGTIQTLANVAFLRLGVVEGAEDAADPSQARLAIDAIAALEPVIGARLPEDAADELRQMLASLQMAFVGSMAAAGGVVMEEIDDDEDLDDGDDGPQGGGPPGGGTPPRPPDPPQPPPRSDRPSIWTPGGEV
jgi:uncharacterized protein DUF1844